MNEMKNSAPSTNEPSDERRSLEIISQMIADTSRKIEQNSSLYFLAWGYTTVLVSIFEYFVWVADLNKSWLWAWWLIPVIGGCATLILIKSMPFVVWILLSQQQRKQMTKHVHC